MWLLDTTTLELKEFVGDSVPPYAILSHTWGSTEDEVTFSEMRKHRNVAEMKPGFSKIRNFCLRAVQEGNKYIWVDSCCIDKRSSAELSEAISSMYSYYQKARVCYAYLADVISSGTGDRNIATIAEADFANSRWFTRGWTLQELIAPLFVCFFAQDWTFIGAKGPLYGVEKLYEPYGLKDSIAIQSFHARLASITGVPEDILQTANNIRSKSVAQRMSWASRRKTTRGEDAAYSLMGLFYISMPVMYGEGAIKAFRRLQLEIIRDVPDQSIFAWRGSSKYNGSGLLARSPQNFRDSSNIVVNDKMIGGLQPYSMTNIGMRINFQILEFTDPDGDATAIASLRCRTQSNETNNTPRRVRIFLKLQRPWQGADRLIYRRSRPEMLDFVDSKADLGSPQDIYVLEDIQLDHFLHTYAIK